VGQSATRRSGPVGRVRPASTKIWIATAIVTFLAAAGTFALPEHFLPLSFVIRAVVFVQSTALAYFYFVPNASRTPLPTTRWADCGWAHPRCGSSAAVRADVLHFRFRIHIEIGLTLLVMLHLAVLLPFQYVLHAYLLHHFSLLLMPVLFTFFGLVIEVLICIALYGWASAGTQPSSGTATHDSPPTPHRRADRPHGPGSLADCGGGGHPSREPAGAGRPAHADQVDAARLGAVPVNTLTSPTSSGRFRVWRPCTDAGALWSQAHPPSWPLAAGVAALYYLLLGIAGVICLYTARHYAFT